MNREKIQTILESRRFRGADEINLHLESLDEGRHTVAMLFDPNKHVFLGFSFFEPGFLDKENQLGTAENDEIVTEVRDENMSEKTRIRFKTVPKRLLRNQIKYFIDEAKRNNYF